MRFAYTCGATPLEGYTIKRGISHGGFGEVYFALSEGGKEVALKCFRKHFEVERRGIQVCLNLKHPNLVHLYDLKTDQWGEPWLVMEYVGGEPLNHFLSQHPSGLSRDLACEFFHGIASAVHYLHERGIVHRDLKPANIFLEHGIIKVGDYSLCKAIPATCYLAQTQNVGTVHYMAPEISRGEYNHSVDVYAAGIILFEMLTGRPVFDGQSEGEILLKHLTERPDLTRVPADFSPILDKALRKDPRERYPSIAEMDKALSVLTASSRRLEPEPASLVIESKVFEPAPLAPTQISVPTEVFVPAQPVSELSGLLLRALTAALIGSLAWSTAFNRGDWMGLAPLFFIVTASSFALVLGARFWTKPLEDSFKRRLALFGVGLGVGCLALWLEGFAGADLLRPATRRSPADGSWLFRALYPDNHTLSVLVCYFAYYGLMFALLRWWKNVDNRRKARVSVPAIFAVAFWAYVLLFLLPTTEERHVGLASMVLTALIVQLVAPRKEPTAAQPVRLRLKTA